MILKAAETNNVCVKEIAVAAKYNIINDKELSCKSKSILNFSVRNPHHAIISLYKKYNNIGDYPPY